MKKYILVTFLSLVVNLTDLNASAYLDWDKAKQIVDAAKLPYNLAQLYKNKQINTVDQDGRTALMKAAESGSKEIVEQLLKTGADVNAVDNSGLTALVAAIDSGSKEIVELLLQAGADVNAVDKYGWTALVAAVRSGSKEMVELLLQADADVNAVDNSGLTALVAAVGSGSKEMVELLLQAGADINAVNLVRVIVLMYAAREESLAMVALLLEKGADINAVDSVGATALMYASQYGSKEAVELLLSKGADINAVDNLGDTALMYVAGVESVEKVALLLERVAEDLYELFAFINAVDSVGATALMYVSQYGSKEAVELLLSKGADINAVDNQGRTAFDYVSDKSILQVLMRYKAFKFVNEVLIFDKEPEPQDYENEEVGNGDLEDELDQAQEQVEAFMKDHIAYWHAKVQSAYEPFVFQNDSAPLRALLTQELSEKMGLILLTIAHFFNSREDFVYVLNQLKDGATEKELKGLQEIIEAEKKSEEGLAALDADMNERYRDIAEYLKKDDAARKIQKAFRENKQRQLNRQ